MSPENPNPFSDHDPAGKSAPWVLVTAVCMSLAAGISIPRVWSELIPTPLLSWPQTILLICLFTGIIGLPLWELIRAALVSMRNRKNRRYSAIADALRTQRHFLTNVAVLSIISAAVLVLLAAIKLSFQGAMP